MSETHGGPTVIVVAPDEGAKVEGEDGGEIQAVVEAEATEEVAGAVVEVARIEAERDITVEAIRAEVDIARTEAMSETEIAEWRTRALAAEELSIVQATELQRLTSLVSLPSPLNPNDSIEPATDEASISSGVEEVEAQAELETPPPEEPPKPKRRAHRWI